MTATVTDSLHNSIEAIKDHDFSGQWPTDIYLDPEARRVYTFLDTNCAPATAYHNIDQLILSVSSKACASSVHEWLMGVEATLAAILDEYQGTEWNGSNHIGQWSQAGLELIEYLGQLPAEIATYWDAGDWFEPVSGELKAKWKSGMTAQQIIDSEDCGNDADGMCDPAEAVEWLEGKIAEWTAEAE